MKIRIIRPYKDILLNRYTKINEILEVTPQRYKELQERIPTFIEVVKETADVITKVIYKGNPLAEVIKDIKEEVKESNKEEKPIKKSTEKKVVKK